MKGYRIIKKFKDLTPAEEKSMAVQLNGSTETIAIINAYLEGEVTNLDRQLSDVDKLYVDGGSHLKVAAILSKRATFLKLRTLLTEKVVVTLDDQSEEV